MADIYWKESEIFCRVLGDWSLFTLTKTYIIIQSRMLDCFIPTYRPQSFLSSRTNEHLRIQFRIYYSRYVILLVTGSTLYIPALETQFKRHWHDGLA